MKSICSISLFHLISGELDLALLGKGGCRGAGWQEGGWPKVKGFLSIDECGAKCVGTRGCTAFHTGKTFLDHSLDATWINNPTSSCNV